MLLAGRRVIAAPLQGMVGDVGVHALRNYLAKADLRRPIIQGNFHKSMIDAAASVGVYAKTGVRRCPTPTEIKPYKTLTL